VLVKNHHIQAKIGSFYDWGYLLGYLKFADEAYIFIPSERRVVKVPYSATLSYWEDEWRLLEREDVYYEDFLAEVCV